MRFQSLGSQYSFRDSVSMLVARGSKHDVAALRTYLSDTYKGEAFVYANARSAIRACLSLFVANDDSIAINSYTCYVVQEAVRRSGAKPSYIDIDPNTAHFSGEALSQAVAKNPQIKAVIIQNTYGIPCDISEIESVARRHDLIIIEDLAHAVGLTYADGRMAGTVGDFVVLSSGRDKLLDTVNGGVLVVRTKKFQDQLTQPTRRIAGSWRSRWYPLLTWLIRATFPVGIGKILLSTALATGLIKRTASGDIDATFTLNPWQARRLLAGLKNLPHTTAHRQKIDAIYRATLRPTFSPASTPIRSPYIVPDRAAVLAALRDHMYFFDDTWFDTPIGPARLYAKTHFPETENPQAVQLAQTVINLPTHRAITPKDAKKIARIVAEACGE